MGFLSRLVTRKVKKLEPEVSGPPVGAATGGAGQKKAQGNAQKPEVAKPEASASGERPETQATDSESEVEQLPVDENTGYETPEPRALSDGSGDEILLTPSHKSSPRLASSPIASLQPTPRTGSASLATPRTGVGRSPPRPASTASSLPGSRLEPEEPLSARLGSGSARPGPSPRVRQKRLPRLLAEVQQHSHYTDTAPPGTVEGWMGHIGQLELFTEELSWLVGDTGDIDVAAPEPSAAEREVLKQLKRYEAEHAELLALSRGGPDYQEKFDEARMLEVEVRNEEQRQVLVEKEVRRRERFLVSLDKEGDCNARALREAEQLEAETSTVVKRNKSLQFQVWEAESRIAKTATDKAHLIQRLQRAEEALANPRHRVRVHTKLQQAEEVRAEEAALLDDLDEMQAQRDDCARLRAQARRSSAKHLSQFRARAEKLRNLGTHLEAAENQLKRQLRMQRFRARQVRPRSVERALVL